MFETFNVMGLIIAKLIIVYQIMIQAISANDTAGARQRPLTAPPNGKRTRYRLN